MEYQLDEECSRITENFMNMLLRVTPGLEENHLFLKVNELLEPLGWSMVTAHIDKGIISRVWIVEMEDK